MLDDRPLIVIAVGIRNPMGFFGIALFEILSVARFAASFHLWDLIPGLRSLRSLTRGYYLPRLRRSFSDSLRVAKPQ
jgi:hypothetical protein